MKVRSKSEAQILRASVALMWLGDKTVTEIAAACGITPLYTQVIACQLRKSGMDLPRRKPAVSRGPRGPQRNPHRPRAKAVRRVARPRPEKRSADHGDILDAWADGVQARDIALLTRRSLGSVKQIVYRGRRAGDARAIAHLRWPAA